MPFPSENRSSLYGLLEKLTTQELDRMLQSELQKQEPDKTSVQLLLEVLEQRQDAQPMEPPTDRELEAWQRYNRKMEQLKPAKKRGWPRGLYMAAVVSLVLVMLFTGLGISTNANPQLQMTPVWKENTLEFVGPDGPDSEFVEYRFHTENPGLQQVYDQVTEMGVDLPVVPMWLPEGYILDDCKFLELPHQKCITASFIKESSVLTYKIDIFDDEIGHEYQTNDENYVLHEYAGIPHKIATNNDFWIVVWKRSDNIECSFTIDCPEEILHEIIRSIYVWEGI